MILISPRPACAVENGAISENVGLLFPSRLAAKQPPFCQGVSSKADFFSRRLEVEPI